GLPPAQVKDLLTTPIENGLSSVKGIRSITSVSREGIATVELEFHWGTDMMMAAVETRETIDLVYPSLPSDSKKPMVLPINPGEEPVLWVGVFSKKGDNTLAYRIAEKEIKTRLQQVTGVGSIVLLGGTREEVQISMDLEKTLGRGIMIDSVADVLAQSNYDFPAGSFIEGETEFLLKTEGRFKSEQDIGRLVVGNTEQGGRVRLGEIAEIRRGVHEKSSFFLFNGKEGIALLVHRKGGESPVKVSKNIQDALADLSQSYGNDLEFIITKDTSQIISSSISDLVISGIIGTLIAFVIILLFVRKLSISMILTASIPFSIIISLLLLRVAGSSLNTMSIGGLALGIGMMVDNSVVVLENLDRRIPLRKDRTQKNIIDFASEMAGPSLGSTLTSLVVFIPIIFLPGIVGALYTDLALSVCFAQLASFVVSITLVPVLYLLANSIKRSAKKEKPQQDSFAKIEKQYRSLLRFVLRKPLVMAAGLAVIFVLGALVLFGIKYEFMPQIDTREVNVTVILPPGTSIDYMERVAAGLSERTLLLSQTESVIARAGGENDDPYFLANPRESIERIHMSVHLKEGSSTVFKTMGELKYLLQMPNAEIIVSLPDDIIAPLLGIDTSGTVLSVAGADTADALAHASRIKSRLVESEFFSTASVIPAKSKPGITLVPDRDTLIRNNISVATVSNTLRGYLDGLYPSKYFTEGREIDMRIRLREQDRGSASQLNLIEMVNSEGGRIKLQDIASITSEKGFGSIIRIDRKDVAFIELSQNTATASAADRLVDNIIRQDPRVESMAASAFEQNLPRIILIFLLSIFLLYLVLGAQFESFTMPLFLMLSLPLSFSGITLGLFVFGKSINLSSSLGILVLLGVVVNNSIILFENYKTKIQAGCNAIYSIYRGSSERLKAISITVLTTVMALVPIAIDPFQRSSQSSMSVAILGGLFLSTILSLFVIPQVFMRYFRRKK
ncbi:MAG: efflux RND transporter permease subunit, partial [Spirochaetaceae bacterium]